MIDLKNESCIIYFNMRNITLIAIQDGSISISDGLQHEKIVLSIKLNTNFTYIVFQ